MKRIGHTASGSKPRKGACAACRSRRIRCNKAVPCNNCLIRGLRCLTVASATSSSNPSSPSIGAVVNSPGSSIRNKGFHRFVTSVDQYLSVVLYSQIIYFWRHGIIPAAKSNDALMNAILCKEIVNNMPKERLISAAIPSEAIEYYVQSLCRPFTRLEDLPLLLMITIIYIEIEWMLSHYQNLDILVLSAMEILYSNRDMLWSRYRRNHLFFAIIAEFMRMSCDAPVNSGLIPLHVWTEVHNLTLKLGREINADGLLLLEIQMFDIYYRLQRPDFDNPSFGWKFVTWEHNMAQLRREQKPGSPEAKRLDHMKDRSILAKIFWNSYHFHFHGNNFCGQVLRASIELHTRKLELILEKSWVKNMAKNPLMHLQVFMYIIPNIAHTIRYARDKTVLQRLIKVLVAFRPWISYYDDLVDYLETMTETGFGYHTALEVAYLGPDLPLMLTGWQLTRVVDQVAVHGFTEILRSKSLPTPMLLLDTQSL